MMSGYIGITVKWWLHWKCIVHVWLSWSNASNNRRISCSDLFCILQTYNFDKIIYETSPDLHNCTPEYFQALLTIILCNWPKTFQLTNCKRNTSELLFQRTARPDGSLRWWLGAFCGNSWHCGDQMDLRWSWLLREAGRPLWWAEQRIARLVSFMLLMESSIDCLGQMFYMAIAG